MKRVLTGIITAFIIVTSVVSMSQPVSAQVSADGAERAAANCVSQGGTWDGQTGRCASDNNCSGSFLGLPTWYKYLELATDSTGRCTVVGPNVPGEENEIDWQKASGYIALAVVEAMLSIAGLVAVGFVIYGGFRYIISQGEPEGAKNARQTIINAVIGLVIALVASGVVRFVAARLT